MVKERKRYQHEKTLHEKTNPDYQERQNKRGQGRKRTHGKQGSIKSEKERLMEREGDSRDKRKVKNKKWEISRKQETTL